MNYYLILMEGTHDHGCDWPVNHVFGPFRRVLGAPGALWLDDLYVPIRHLSGDGFNMPVITYNYVHYKRWALTTNPQEFTPEHLTIPEQRFLIGITCAQRVHDEKEIAMGTPHWNTRN